MLTLLVCFVLHTYIVFSEACPYGVFMRNSSWMCLKFNFYLPPFWHLIFFLRFLPSLMAPHSTPLSHFSYEFALYLTSCPTSSHKQLVPWPTIFDYCTVFHSLVIFHTLSPLLRSSALHIYLSKFCLIFKACFLSYNLWKEVSHLAIHTLSSVCLYIPVLDHVHINENIIY